MRERGRGWSARGGMFATGGGFTGSFGHAMVTESSPEIFGWAVKVEALPGTSPANNETRFRAYVSCAKAGAR